MFVVLGALSGDAMLVQVHPTRGNLGRGTMLHGHTAQVSSIQVTSVSVTVPEGSVRLLDPSMAPQIDDGGATKVNVGLVVTGSHDGVCRVWAVSMAAECLAVIPCDDRVIACQIVTPAPAPPFKPPPQTTEGARRAKGEKRPSRSLAGMQMTIPNTMPPDCVTMAMQTLTIVTLTRSEAAVYTFQQAQARTDAAPSAFPFTPVRKCVIQPTAIMNSNSTSVRQMRSFPGHSALQMNLLPKPPTATETLASIGSVASDASHATMDDKLNATLNAADRDRVAWTTVEVIGQMYPVLALCALDGSVRLYDAFTGTSLIELFLPSPPTAIGCDALRRLSIIGDANGNLYRLCIDQQKESA